jgi:hypothetical protein
MGLQLKTELKDFNQISMSVMDATSKHLKKPMCFSRDDRFICEMPNFLLELRQKLMYSFDLLVKCDLGCCAMKSEYPLAKRDDVKDLNHTLPPRKKRLYILALYRW